VAAHLDGRPTGPPDKCRLPGGPVRPCLLTMTYPKTHMNDWFCYECILTALFRWSSKIPISASASIFGTKLLLNSDW